MKNPFKKKIQPKPELEVEVKRESDPPKRMAGFHVFAIPEHQYKIGNLLRLEEDGGEMIEPEEAVFGRLNKKIDVHFNPRPVSWEDYWEIIFDLDYSLNGTCYGKDGPASVKEVGLRLPADGRLELKDDRAAWRTKFRPTSQEIGRVIEDIQNQVYAILDEYRRTRAIMRVVKSGEAV